MPVSFEYRHGVGIDTGEKMMLKTSELRGAALDWAVALIEYPEWKEQGYLEVFPHDLSFDDGTTYAPSTDWAQGGPIIEREIDAIYRTRISTGVVTWEAVAQGDSECMGYGGNTTYCRHALLCRQQDGR
jgi:hypothetical protein